MTNLWTCHQYMRDEVRPISLDLARDSGELVCVIGAGATGIGIAGMLWRYGLKTVVVDRRAQLGGIWTDANSVYAGLALHAPSYYYQYLDDELLQQAHADELLASRRNVREQRDYFEQYARSHELLFLSGVDARHRYSNSLELTDLSTMRRGVFRFRWVIDCRLARLNGGRVRVLQNTSVLSETILRETPKDARIAVVGAGKSGADALVSLRERGFGELSWICSRKIGFQQREGMEDRLRVLTRQAQHSKNWIEERRQTFVTPDELVSPHDELDCTKLGIVSRDELELLKGTHKVYSRVEAVRSASDQRSKTVHLSGGATLAADVVISAIGPDPLPMLQDEALLARRYGDKLLLGMIDPDNRVIYARNSHLETATGASLLGLLFAQLIHGAVTTAQVAALKRVALPFPALMGCMMGSQAPAAGALSFDGMVIEAYVLSLLGHPESHSFRLLDEGLRRTLLRM